MKLNLAIMCLLISSFSLEASEGWRQFKYEISLGWLINVSGQAWWNKIEPLNLYLGAIPLQPDHLKAIQNLGVTSVISMLEPFELEESLVATPVTPQDWVRVGIKTKQISARDFKPLKRAQIEEGITYLHQELEARHMVYIHCKAGRGRSAGIVVAYLMRYYRMTFEEAYDFVKRQRPEIHFNTAQKNVLEQVNES